MSNHRTNSTNTQGEHDASTYKTTTHRDDDLGELRKHDTLVSDADALRFRVKVVRDEPDECWEWSAYRDQDGYGRFSLDGEKVRAHRVAVMIDGRDPTGLIVRHTCDNPGCVNPRHLELGTAQDNAEDMVRRDRQPRGERNGQSKLTEEEVLDIRESTKPSAELADRYGVNSSTIRMIRTYATWTHLEGDTHVHRET